MRINRGAVQASTEQLVEELEKLGVDAEPSRFLPDEFLRVNAGMQQLIAGGLLADGQCQVQMRLKIGTLSVSSPFLE